MEAWLRIENTGISIKGAIVRDADSKVHLEERMQVPYAIGGR